jgi:hypothetical protein
MEQKLLDEDAAILARIEELERRSTSYKVTPDGTLIPVKLSEAENKELADLHVKYYSTNAPIRQYWKQY